MAEGARAAGGAFKHVADDEVDGLLGQVSLEDGGNGAEVDDEVPALVEVEDDELDEFDFCWGDPAGPSPVRTMSIEARVSPQPDIFCDGDVQIWLDPPARVDVGVLDVLGFDRHVGRKEREELQEVTADGRSSTCFKAPLRVRESNLSDCLHPSYAAIYYLDEYTWYESGRCVECGVDVGVVGKGEGEGECIVQALGAHVCECVFV